MRRASTHEEKVARVAARLRAHDPNKPLSFRKRSVSHVVPKQHDAAYEDEALDLTDLDAILSIDTEARTCTAEPGVTFEALVQATLPLGLAPIIVPELKGITVGGAVTGCSLESRSFTHGGFHDGCLEYEIVTARGEVVTATPESLLFQMMHGSFGTLGVLSKLVFRLLPAKPFVHVVHEKYGSFADYLSAIERRFRARDVDFMDGIIHAPHEHVLSLGSFVDDAPYANRYDWTKVYYKSTAERADDYLRTEHYFFRYDHGVTNVHPKTVVGRAVFGKFMGSERLLRLARRVHALLDDEHPDVTLDVFVPFSRASEFMRWYREAIDFFPIWCVPYRLPRTYEWIASDYFQGIDDELFLDLAMYGLHQPAGRNLYRELEEELFRVRGIKTLISHNYYSEDEFWRVFNGPNWRAIKSLTDPDNVFRDLYAKTCVSGRSPG